MEREIGIRYQTPEGATGVWVVLRSALPQSLDGDKALQAYLAHWHPTYTYLGRDGGPDVRREVVPEPPPPSGQIIHEEEDLIGD